ncbi:MAG: porin [Steroidobacteraceae bacterium]|jgi:predicted porin
MSGARIIKWLATSLTAALLVFSYAAGAVAQTADQDQQAKMRILQERIDQLSKDLKTLQTQQATTEKTVNAASGKLNTFMKGFFGTLDVSIDETTKGMNGMVAYGSALAPGVTSPTGPFINTGVKGGGAGPFGRVSWMTMMSSNGSNVGYRGTHQIGLSDVDFIYQVATSLDMAAAPGLNDTWTKTSNTVTGAIGLGDTYIGFQGHGSANWGKLRLGEMFMPYKTSTDRLNPFAGMLGNYSVIMGNTGGDNRIEFGTRMDHVISYASPDMSGFSFEAAYALGQNPDPNSNLTSLGSVDCSGGNSPGSGNLFLNCDDGGFDNAFSGDLKFETGGLYLVAAYEVHTNVNRSSDGVGANNPYYAYLYSLGPNNPLSAKLLDWSDFLAYEAENPGEALAGSPEYNTAVDVVNEWAMKFGGQYTFDFGLTISYLYEDLHRSLPADMEFQNERQRTGDWLSVEYNFPNGADRIAAGWAHAGASVGDPGGQHNYMPAGVGNNQANMTTLAWWHKFDKQFTWYADIADTSNDGNAHYDIGAGGHGIKTDCHDATHPLFIDYSSAGPTTWGGCHEIGFSTGVNFKF